LPHCDLISLRSELVLQGKSETVVAEVEFETVSHSTLSASELRASSGKLQLTTKSPFSSSILEKDQLEAPRRGRGGRSLTPRAILIATEQGNSSAPSASVKDAPRKDPRAGSSISSRLGAKVTKILFGESDDEPFEH